MSDLNTLTLQGRIARDAVLQTTKGGKQIALFTLAVNQTKKSADGDYFEHANFFPISVFVQSDKFASYLKKGQSLILEGYLKQVTKKLGQGEDGKDRYDSKLYICTSKVHFIFCKKSEEERKFEESEIENFGDDLIIETEASRDDVYLGDEDAILLGE